MNLGCSFRLFYSHIIFTCSKLHNLGERFTKTMRSKFEYKISGLVLEKLQNL